MRKKTKKLRQFISLTLQKHILKMVPDSIESKLTPGVKIESLMECVNVVSVLVGEKSFAVYNSNVKMDSENIAVYFPDDLFITSIKIELKKETLIFYMDLDEAKTVDILKDNFKKEEYNRCLKQNFISMEHNILEPVFFEGLEE